LKVNVEADTAEMASLYRGTAHIGLFPGEVLFVKAFLTPNGLTPDNRTGGFMLGTSNFTCGDAGNYHADFRWLDGIAGLNRGTTLVLVDQVLYKNGEYLGNTLGMFEIQHSRLGTISDATAQLKQISTDRGIIRLP